MYILWSSRVPLLKLGARVRGGLMEVGWANTEKVGSVHRQPAYPGFWPLMKQVFLQSWGLGYGNKGRMGIWGRLARH